MGVGAGRGQVTRGLPVTCTKHGSRAYHRKRLNETLYHNNIFYLLSVTGMMIFLILDNFSSGSSIVILSTAPDTPIEDIVILEALSNKQILEQLMQV